MNKYDTTSIQQQYFNHMLFLLLRSIAQLSLVGGSDPRVVSDIRRYVDKLVEARFALEGKDEKGNPF